MTPKRHLCECLDLDCPMHKNVHFCRNNGMLVLYRIDMYDASGTLLCIGCANDVMKSGLFSYRDAV